jgi:hypothetical protein
MVVTTFNCFVEHVAEKCNTDGAVYFASSYTITEIETEDFSKSLDLILTTLHCQVIHF